MSGRRSENKLAVPISRDRFVMEASAIMGGWSRRQSSAGKWPDSRWVSCSLFQALKQSCQMQVFLPHVEQSALWSQSRGSSVVGCSLNVERHSEEAWRGKGSEALCSVSCTVTDGSVGGEEYKTFCEKGLKVENPKNWWIYFGFFFFAWKTRKNKSPSKRGSISWGIVLWSLQSIMHILYPKHFEILGGNSPCGWSVFVHSSTHWNPPLPFFFFSCKWNL